MIRFNVSKITLFALLVSSCSTNSILIRRDDQTFLAAQQKLQHTDEVVNTFKPTPFDRSIFMQAENFYQYRFSPPERSTKKYVIEAAAAITDFPGFQSLAGSLDLQDLRYRAPDSAAQLWESLLEYSPQSNLKPLTLYRLGWAYRNIGVPGLPRTSPDEAFDELILEYPDDILASYAREAKLVPWKSKDTAASWSLIPGFGQLYLGETKNGLARFGIAVASLIAIAVPVYSAAQGGHSSTLDIASGFGGFIVLSFDFTSSYEDAMRGVIQWNERTENNFNFSHPTAP